MIISLLMIAIPTVLILIVLILVINKKNKGQAEELSKIREQLEMLNDIHAEDTVAEENEEVQEVLPEENTAVIAEAEPTEEIQDAEEILIEKENPEASAYNTGKSGKVYTKEELELLIKE